MVCGFILAPQPSPGELKALPATHNVKVPGRWRSGGFLCERFSEVYNLQFGDTLCTVTFFAGPLLFTEL